jgi:hypothetical protein
LAEVAQAEGLSASVLSIETIRQALLRLEVGWKRAKMVCSQRTNSA